MFLVLARHPNYEKFRIFENLKLLKDLTSTIFNLLYGSQEKGTGNKKID